MMTQAEPTVLQWACPICTTRIDVTMTWTPRKDSLIRVRKIDDIDARVHMQWHRMCTCRWEHMHSDDQDEPVAVLFYRAAGCEMHP